MMQKLESTARGVLALGLAGLLLGGCKRADAPPPKIDDSAAASSASTRPHGDVLFSAQRDALDKAKAVEGQLQQQAQDQEKAIDAAQK
jgi:hypothetical protein